MARLDPPDLPEVTDAHRRVAFESLRLVGCTYDAAMADHLRRRIVEARAHQLRLREWQDTHTRTVRYLPACAPSGDRWTSRRAPGEWVRAEPDLFTQP